MSTPSGDWEISVYGVFIGHFVLQAVAPLMLSLAVVLTQTSVCCRKHLFVLVDYLTLSVFVGCSYVSLLVLVFLIQNLWRKWLASSVYVGLFWNVF